MSHETITSPEQGELELARIIENYRELPIATAEVYGFFDVDGTPEIKEEREQAKQAFLNDKIRNPQLTYPKLHTTETASFLETSEKQILDLMHDAVSLDHDRIRVRAAEDILRTAYLKVAIIQIACELQDAQLSPKEKAERSELFNLANDEVHGRLEPEIFFDLVEGEREFASRLQTNSNSTAGVALLADEYLQLLPLTQVDNSTKRFKPTDETIEALKDIAESEYADLLTLVPKKPDGETLSIDELVELYEAAHVLRGTGWGVRVVPGKTNIESKQSEKATLLGGARKLLTSRDAAKLLLHENGVHVERRMRGDNLGDPMLEGVGLAGYEDFEEGLGVALEEAMDGKIRNSGEQYYLALGLARGLDGRPRDFRDTFEIAWLREALKKVKNGVVDSDMIDKARNQAYIQCTRIFRGTPCDVPGLVYTKDQSYLNGNKKAWPVLSEVAALPPEERSRAFNVLLSAKYDPTNEVHRALVAKALTGDEVHGRE